jgi:site-specific DNA-cytosine methylase
MKVLELFAGIGGIGLGLHELGWETVAFSEFDPKIAEKKKGRQYAAEVMQARFPDAVDVGDVTKLTFARNRAGIQGVLRAERICGEDNAEIVYYDPLYKGDVDIIAGGFPCQDISHAGKGAGIKEGTRSGLWSYFADAIEGLTPRGVIIENVAALAGRGLDIVLCDLARIGYDCEWDVIPAAGVGAPHLRERLFIIAWPQGGGRHGQWPAPPAFDHWRVEPDVPRLTTDKIDQRAARLRCLGNAVVPQVAEWVGSILRSRIEDERMDQPDPSEWDLRHKSGELKGEQKFCGWAVDLEPSIAGMKLQRAGRMTCGEVYERPRSCEQRDAKRVGLECLAPTLRPTHPSSPPLMPTPAAGNFNDGEDPEVWLERRERLKATSDAGNGAGVPLGIAVKLLPTATAKDAKASRNASAIRSPDAKPVNPGETLTDYVDPTNGGRLPFGAGGPAPEGRLLPTPIATDGEKVSTGTLARLAQFGERTAPGDVRDDRAPRADGVVQNAPRKASSGRLNPAWVEWLQGFPQGWSEL